MFSVEIYFLGFVQEKVFGEYNKEAFKTYHMQKKTCKETRKLDH